MTTLRQEPEGIPSAAGVQREAGTIQACPGSGGPPASSDAELDRRFQELASEWKSQRGYSSSITKMAMHQAYQQIIGLGPRAIPLLLRELEREPDHWFWALKVLTGINPVPPEARGHIEQMAAHWLAWGRQQGYQW